VHEAAAASVERRLDEVMMKVGSMPGRMMALEERTICAETSSQRLAGIFQELRREIAQLLPADPSEASGATAFAEGVRAGAAKEQASSDMFPELDQRLATLSKQVEAIQSDSTVSERLGRAEKDLGSVHEELVELQREISAQNEADSLGRLRVEDIERKQERLNQGLEKLRELQDQGNPSDELLPRLELVEKTLLEQRQLLDRLPSMTAFTQAQEPSDEGQPSSRHEANAEEAAASAREVVPEETPREPSSSSRAALPRGDEGAEAAAGACAVMMTGASPGVSEVSDGRPANAGEEAAGGGHLPGRSVSSQTQPTHRNASSAVPGASSSSSSGSSNSSATGAFMSTARPNVGSAGRMPGAEDGGGPISAPQQHTSAMGGGPETSAGMPRRGDAEDGGGPSPRSSWLSQAQAGHSAGDVVTQGSSSSSMPHQTLGFTPRSGGNGDAGSGEVGYGAWPHGVIAASASTSWPSSGDGAAGSANVGGAGDGATGFFSWPHAGDGAAGSSSSIGAVVADVASGFASGAWPSAGDGAAGSSSSTGNGDGSVGLISSSWPNGADGAGGWGWGSSWGWGGDGAAGGGSDMLGPEAGARASANIVTTGARSLEGDGAAGGGRMRVLAGLSEQVRVDMTEGDFGGGGGLSTVGGTSGSGDGEARGQSQGSRGDRESAALGSGDVGGGEVGGGSTARETTNAAAPSAGVALHVPNTAVSASAAKQPSAKDKGCDSDSGFDTDDVADILGSADMSEVEVLEHDVKADPEGSVSHQDMEPAHDLAKSQSAVTAAVLGSRMPEAAAGSSTSSDEEMKKKRFESKHFTVTAPVVDTGVSGGGSRSSSSRQSSRSSSGSNLREKDTDGSFQSRSSAPQAGSKGFLDELLSEAVHQESSPSLELTGHVKSSPKAQANARSQLPMAMEEPDLEDIEEIEVQEIANDEPSIERQASNSPSEGTSKSTGCREDKVELALHDLDSESEESPPRSVPGSLDDALLSLVSSSGLKGRPKASVPRRPFQHLTVVDSDNDDDDDYDDDFEDEQSPGKPEVRSSNLKARSARASTVEIEITDAQSDDS